MQLEKTPFYKKNWFIFLSLTFFFPLGVIIDNSENQTNQLRNSVENELHLGKVQELGQFGTNTNILISIDHNLTKNMTKKTINQAIAQTLIGINKANTDVKSANIGIKINGTRVASSRWNEDAINNIEKYKNEIYDNPAKYAESFNNTYK